MQTFSRMDGLSAAITISENSGGMRVVGELLSSIRVFLRRGGGRAMVGRPPLKPLAWPGLTALSCCSMISDDRLFVSILLALVLLVLLPIMLSLLLLPMVLILLSSCSTKPTSELVPVWQLDIIDGTGILVSTTLSDADGRRDAAGVV